MTALATPLMGEMPHPYSLRWWALLILCLSLLVIELDNTIVNVALPTIQRDLGASASDLQWIVDAYVLVLAGLLLVAGSLGDRFGRKRVLFVGLLIFAAGSCGAALAANITALVSTRLVMGVGGACIMPATLSITTNIFAGKERTRAISAWAAISGLGIILGPVTGGWLLEHYQWGAIFLVNVPIIAVTLLAGFFLIPESRDPAATPLDPIGALLSIGFLTTLLFGIIEQPTYGWGDASIRVAFGAAAILMVAFVLWEMTRRAPMLDLRLFRNMRFTAASLAIALIFFALFGVIFFLTQYLQLVLGYTPLEAGTRLAPLVLGLLLSAPFSAWLVGQLGTKLTVAAGMSIVTGCLAFWATTSITDGYSHLAVGMVGIGFGIGLAMIPATDSIMGALPLAKAGVGSATNDVTRQVGGSLGVALLGSILTSGYSAALASSLQSLPPSLSALARNSLSQALFIAQNMGPQGIAFASNARAAFVQGMDQAIGVAAGVALGGVLIALFFLPARVQRVPLPDDALTPEHIEELHIA